MLVRARRGSSVVSQVFKERLEKKSVQGLVLVGEMSELFRRKNTVSPCCDKNGTETSGCVCVNPCTAVLHEVSDAPWS